MSKQLHNSKNQIRQRGVGIIEVLVALVVVSFGVLGMASLQLTGMKHSTGGFNRAKALMFSENIATRMRINEKGVETGKYGNFDSSTGLNCGSVPKQCQATPSKPNPPMCNPEDLAKIDLFTLACGDITNAGTPADGVQESLPSGQVTVICDQRDVGTGACLEKSTHTITVTWAEGSVASDDKTAQVNRRVQVRLQP